MQHIGSLYRRFDSANQGMHYGLEKLGFWRPNPEEADAFPLFQLMVWTSRNAGCSVAELTDYWIELLSMRFYAARHIWKSTQTKHHERTLIVWATIPG